VNLRAEGDLLVLNDAAGKEVSVSKGEVKAQTNSQQSLMPAIFEQALSEKDLADLVAFLISQTDEPAK
jgi:hypothetical protein